jgi:glutamate-1-semialdehyde 2,1-aminomutase
MLENGVYIAPSQFEAMFVSFAHSDKDIDYTCRIIESFKA